MFKVTIKIYEKALGELPKTDRDVLAWRKGMVISPKALRFIANRQSFYWNHVLMSPDYWCYLEQLNKQVDKESGVG